MKPNFKILFDPDYDKADLDQVYHMIIIIYHIIYHVVVFVYYSLTSEIASRCFSVDFEALRM